MGAAQFNLDPIEQGADWFLYLTFQEEDGSPTNLTGCDLHLQIRSDYGVAPVVDISVSGGGIAINEAANGTATGHVSWSQSANITGGNYIYDLKLISATGIRDRELKGGIPIDPQVTI